MPDTFVVIIGGATTIIVALIGFATKVMLARMAHAERAAELAKIAAEETHAEIVATAKGIYELGRRVDGRMDELLHAARGVAEAKGYAAGEQAQRDRAAPGDGS